MMNGPEKLEVGVLLHAVSTWAIPLFPEST
jgi:hypothetical protein